MRVMFKILKKVFGFCKPKISFVWYSRTQRHPGSTFAFVMQKEYQCSVCWKRYSCSSIDNFYEQFYFNNGDTITYHSNRISISHEDFHEES